MSPCSWKKYPEPVFSAKNGVYAPGHNANFYSPDGKETWNVYHAVSIGVRGYVYSEARLTVTISDRTGTLNDRKEQGGFPSPITRRE
jgi:GH43 family beta-xylosidase